MRWRLGGAPGGTRTPGLLVRSQSLYPAELRAQLPHYTSSRKPVSTNIPIKRRSHVTSWVRWGGLFPFLESSMKRCH